MLRTKGNGSDPPARPPGPLPPGQGWPQWQSWPEDAGAALLGEPPYTTTGGFHRQSVTEFQPPQSRTESAGSAQVATAQWPHLLENNPYRDRDVLITGGTGSLGHALVPHILEAGCRRLIVFSRDELKQSQMREQWPDGPGDRMRYFIGDVRDKERLRRAFAGVSVVIHAAALKQVPACEYNPREPILTNVFGGINVIDAALDASVEKCLLISSDKACAPLNVYGRTKALAESLFVQANSYVGSRNQRFAAVRYGNVMGSRGSVLLAFLGQRERGEILLTDRRSTRFWLSLAGAVGVVDHALRRMLGGEIFIPKLPSVSIADLAEIMAPGVPVRVTGLRPGEKLHEMLISPDEARQAIDTGDHYILQPAHPWWAPGAHAGKPVPDGWYYGSDASATALSPKDLRAVVEAWRHGA